MERFSVNVLSDHFKIFLFLGGTLSLAIILFFLRQGDIRLLYLFFSLVILIAYFLYQAFGRTIEMDKEGVGFQSWFRSYHLKWTEVKSFGVFLHTSVSEGNPLSEELLDEDFFRGIKLIYLSSDPKPILKNTNNERFICFEFRKWIYDLLKLKLGRRV